MNFTENTRLTELDKEFGADYLITGGYHFSPEREGMSLKELQEENPTWAVSDMLKGLERLKQEPKPMYMKLGENSIPNLICLPAAEKKTDTFALLVAGGGYRAVCTMVETLPIAAILNELGMDCYCLIYRTAPVEHLFDGLLPKPLDDVARALRWIFESRGKVDAYITAGFSAGGHVTAVWGTESAGALHYCLPQPKGQLLGYPAILFGNGEKEEDRFIYKIMYGEGSGQEVGEKYNPVKQMTENYPPFYLVRAADDPIIPSDNGDQLVEAAKQHGVRCQMVTAKEGGHGFGAGSETELAGWVERGLEFLK